MSPPRADGPNHRFSGKGTDFWNGGQWPSGMTTFCKLRPTSRIAVRSYSLGVMATRNSWPEQRHRMTQSWHLLSWGAADHRPYGERLPDVFEANAFGASISVQPKVKAGDAEHHHHHHNNHNNNHNDNDNKQKTATAAATATATGDLSKSWIFEARVSKQKKGKMIYLNVHKTVLRLVDEKNTLRKSPIIRCRVSQQFLGIGPFLRLLEDLVAMLQGEVSPLTHRSSTESVWLKRLLLMFGLVRTAFYCFFSWNVGLWMFME